MVWFQLLQPTKLEGLATIKLAKWITLHAEHLMNPISNPLDYEAANKAEDLLSQQIETIRNYFKYMPGMLQNKLLTELMRQLCDLLQKVFPSRGWEDFTEPFHQRHVTDRVLEILFTKNLTCLSLNHAKLDTFGASFSSKSYMLNSLTDLKLDIEPECSKEHEMQSNIIRLLKGLHNLKYVSISFCTDNILRCIADNCKQIEKLDLHNYLGISNNTIEVLTKLPNLKSVDLYESTVIIMNVSEYQIIENRKRRILEHIASKKQFEIKSYVNYGVSTQEQLQIVIKKYPLIESLILYKTGKETLQSYIEPLIDLHNLRELNIKYYDFYAGQVKEVLQVVGTKVQTLHLLGVDDMDLNALKIISLVCPHLQDFTLSGCTFVEETVVDDLIPCNIEISPFKNLQSFTLNNYWGQNAQTALLFVLSNCVNIEFIDIYRDSLTDDQMLEILDKNPLACLKELKLFNELTKSVLERIIKNCKSPEVIFYKKRGIHQQKRKFS